MGKLLALLGGLTAGAALLLRRKRTEDDLWQRANEAADRAERQAE